MTKFFTSLAALVMPADCASGSQSALPSLPYMQDGSALHFLDATGAGKIEIHFQLSRRRKADQHATPKKVL
jgi:hypothetical protein